MQTARITGIGTAVPHRRYTQEELMGEIVEPYFQSNPRAALIFQNAGIEFRHLATPPDFYAQEQTTLSRNTRYMQAAPQLAQEAIRACLQNAGLQARDVDDLIILSCTGIDTPGLDLILAGSMNMRPDLRRSTILGMGCYAALPGLARAHQSVTAHPGTRTLVVAVEICSLHFQPDDPSLENAVCSALFADGAAAALISSRAEDAGPAARASIPQLIDFATHCDYQTLDQMAFHLTDHGFQMRLSSYVPKVLSAQVEDFVDGLLSKNGLARSDIQRWAVHPGSNRILDYIQERLSLPEDALDASREVLSCYGNMSSPTILFILDEIQRQSPPPMGSYGLLLAFGPGLTMEAALLRW